MAARRWKRARIAISRGFRPRSEVKHFDFLQTPAFAKAAGSDHFLGAVAEGSDSTDRNGRRIFPISLDLKFTTASETLTSGYCRILVIRSKGKYTLTQSDYLATYLSGPNIDRCSVLYDKLLVASSFVTTSGQSGPSNSINLRIPLGKKQITFSGTTGADDQDGQIIILVYSNADDYFKYSVYSRLWFKDV